MKCHTLSCTNDARPGSSYCEDCKPPKAKTNTLEDAQVRVAKAQDAKDALHMQIMKKHGSIAELDAACRGDRYAKRGGPKDLRRQYDRAVKELRLAKSDLARMRNEAEQKGEVSVSVNGGPEAPAGSPEASAAVGSVMQHIAERIEEGEAAREKRRATKQVDLNGDELQLPAGVKETKKVSRSRVYEITDFKISVKEDDLANFNQWPSFKQRTFVAMKLRYVPEDEDAIYSNDDFDDAVERMIAILIRAAFILAVEREREAILLQRLAEVV